MGDPPSWRAPRHRGQRPKRERVSPEEGTAAARTGQAGVATAVGTGILATSRVPPPTGLTTSSEPSIDSSRSARPRSPGPGRCIGPADPVIGDLDGQLIVTEVGTDECSARLGVLRDVGERLRDREVHRALDDRREAHGPDLDPDVDRRPRGERVNRRAEARLGEDLRVDAAGELAELGEGGLRLGRGLVEAELRGRVEVVAEARPCQAQRERQRYETLLGAVVEVAFDPLSLGVPGRDDPRPRRLDLVELGLDLGLESGVVGGERLEALVDTRVGDGARSEPEDEPPQVADRPVEAFDRCLEARPNRAQSWTVDPRA